MSPGTGEFIKIGSALDEAVQRNCLGTWDEQGEWSFRICGFRVGDWVRSRTDKIYCSPLLTRNKIYGRISKVLMSDADKA